jgi:hypothetical protein
MHLYLPQTPRYTDKCLRVIIHNHPMRPPIPTCTTLRINHFPVIIHRITAKYFVLFMSLIPQPTDPTNWEYRKSQLF